MESKIVYEEPIVEVVEFSSTDAITASDPNAGEWDPLGV